MRLPGILVEHLRLAARDLDAFVHEAATSAYLVWRGNGCERLDSIGEQARALRRSADVMCSGRAAAESRRDRGARSTQRSSVSRRESGLSSPRPTAAHASIDARRSDFVQALAVSAGADRLHHHRLRSRRTARTCAGFARCAARRLAALRRRSERASRFRRRRAALREERAAVRAVVERSLQKVRRGVLPSHVGIRRKQARERADSFAKDRIPLERHRRTSDLLLGRTARRLRRSPGCSESARRPQTSRATRRDRRVPASNR